MLVVLSWLDASQRSCSAREDWILSYIRTYLLLLFSTHVAISGGTTYYLVVLFNIHGTLWPPSAFGRQYMYCIVLSSTVQYCVVLSSTLQYCIVLSSILQYCVVLYSTLQYCIVLSSTLQYCVVLSSTLQYCIVLSSTLQYCVVLSSTLQYSIVLSSTLNYAVSIELSTHMNANTYFGHISYALFQDCVHMFGIFNCK